MANDQRRAIQSHAPTKLGRAAVVVAVAEVVVADVLCPRSYWWSESYWRSSQRTSVSAFR